MTVIERIEEFAQNEANHWQGKMKNETGFDLVEATARYSEASTILSMITGLRNGGSLPAEQSDNIGKHKEQPEANGLPNKRTRVNYAICELQAFKPLREAIVLDSYVYDEGKCYRENLLNYIHAIPESRLAEIRSYLKENEWWPYDDDADWMEQEQPEVDLKTGIELIAAERQRQINVEGYTEQHDSQHPASALIYAAIAYVESAKVGVNCMEIGNTDKLEIRRRKVEMGNHFPFGWLFKPSTDVRDLVKAGALIAAAIDRLTARKEE